jgi:hypothetical protein
VLWEGKKEEDVCEEVLNSYVWRGAHRKGVCKDYAWKELVYQMFVTKASGLLVLLIVFFKSAVGFVSKLNQS